MLTYVKMKMNVPSKWMLAFPRTFLLFFSGKSNHRLIINAEWTYDLFSKLAGFAHVPHADFFFSPRSVCWLNFPSKSRTGLMHLHSNFSLSPFLSVLLAPCLVLYYGEIVDMYHHGYVVGNMFEFGGHHIVHFGSSEMRGKFQTFQTLQEWPQEFHYLKNRKKHKSVQNKTLRNFGRNLPLWVQRWFGSLEQKRKVRKKIYGHYWSPWPENEMLFRSSCSRSVRGILHHAGHCCPHTTVPPLPVVVQRQMQV